MSGLGNGFGTGFGSEVKDAWCSSYWLRFRSTYQSRMVGPNATPNFGSKACEGDRSALRAPPSNSVWYSAARLALRCSEAGLSLLKRTCIQNVRLWNRRWLCRSRKHGRVLNVSQTLSFSILFLKVQTTQIQGM